MPGRYLLALAGALFAATAQAQPFGLFDVRSAGMGGIGVATGARYATFNNPALLVTAANEQEWFVMAPGISRWRGDSNGLEARFDDFRRAADALEAGSGSAAEVQASLDAMQGGLYREGGNTAILVAVPSRILSGAAYVHLYDWANTRPVIGGDDLSDPANPRYASALEHRGARVLENGVTTAKALSGGGWKRQMAVGFNFKYVFVEGYGYRENVRDGKLAIDRNQNYDSGSAFNLDLGLLKEFGVWKIGLMAKNLFTSQFEYGDSGETFAIAPQFRAGLAYQSRRTVFELDVDLNRNPPAGFDGDTQMLSLGTEHYPWPWLALRAGYQFNLAAEGDTSGMGSLGLGLVMGYLSVDLAGTWSREQVGAFAQLGLQFY